MSKELDSESTDAQQIEGGGALHYSIYSSIIPVIFSRLTTSVLAVLRILRALKQICLQKVFKNASALALAL